MPACYLDHAWRLAVCRQGVGEPKQRRPGSRGGKPKDIECAGEGDGGGDDVDAVLDSKQHRSPP